MKFRVLDLFSGIGGFSLGLERTGGFETVAFCEIEEYPRRVLAKHWPKVPCYHDVRELTADTLRRDGIAVDVICGGFRARTYLELGLAPASMESVQVSGESSHGSLASYDPATRSWRTWQRSLTTEWEPFSETWPTSGMMRNGRLYLRAPWVHHTCDSACSQWPTPTASMDGRGFGIPLHERTSRYKKSTILRVHALVKEHGWRIHPRFTEALMSFPSGWSEIAQSATASILKFRGSSAARSCKQKA